MISLSIGARIDAKRRSRGAPGSGIGARAPVSAVPPVLEGTGRIGDVLRVEPGRWEGDPSPALSVRWLRAGREISATGIEYRPGPEDDGTEIAARVTARNSAGTASAVSPARRITRPAPEAGPPIPDQFHILESGEFVLNVSSHFEGGALRFSVTGDGVSIDPETGILSIATDTLRDGVSVTVTAVNSGGAVAQTFRLDVALPDIALPVAPEMVVPPSLPDIAPIGSEVAVEAGSWSGTPVPELTYQWLLDGVEIAGAVEAVRRPLATEDGSVLACRVTATNAAGTAAAVSSAAAVRHAVPRAAGGLADLMLDAGSGPVTVAAGAEFSGENLAFSVTGSGAAIDSATGLVTISTDDLQTEEPIIVTAGNSGGSATSTFRVTVRPVAPSLRAAPSLDGTGVIGEAVIVEPGLWDGAPAPELSFRWICGGEDVAGATEAAYVPGPAEDGKELVCEVTATNEGGAQAARTPALALVLPAPRVIGSLADVSAVQGAPAPEIDVAAAFSGMALAFAVEGEGVEVDAATGRLSVATDTLRTGAEVLVTASNSGGAATIRFRVDITERLFVPVPPLMLAGPVLVGSAKVGAAMNVETGSWSGDPAPSIACQWLRDGVDVEGATGTGYVPDAADDLAEIACRVTARNSGGSAEAVTAALTVTHVAPVAKGELFEEILDEGTGPQEIPTAQDFEGEALVFAVEGAAAVIDAATGIVSIPTDSPVDGATVTVTATNSGGAAASSFLVTIEAAEVEEPAGPPAPLADDQWRILRSEPSPEIAAGSFRPVVAINADLAVQAAQWTTSASTPPLPEHWETLAPTEEPGTFVTEMLNQGTGDWHVFTEAQEFRRTKGLSVRYRLAADGAWSEASTAKSVPVPEVADVDIDPEPDPLPVAGEWSMMHLSSKRAFENRTRYRYGRSAWQIQFCHGGERSEANPNDAAFIMDVGGPWVTENAEADWPTYRLASCRNLEQKNSVSLCWDPDVPGRFLYVAGVDRDLGQGVGLRAGIYESTDKGETMNIRLSEYVQSGTRDRSSRSYRKVITYDPANHDVWYFLNPKQRLWKSTNRGASWSVLNGTSQVSAMGQAYYVHVDYGNSNTIWFAAWNGLYKSTNGGSTISRVSPSGLPSGMISNLCFDPDDPNKFMAVVYDVGLYRTTNGGASFTKVSTPRKAVSQVFQSPVNKNILWIIGINTGLAGGWSAGPGYYSENGGASWTQTDEDGTTYGIDRPESENIMRASGGESRAMATAILPSPLVAKKAIGTWGHCLWATKNGKDWVNSSDGFSNHAGGDTNFGAMSFHPDGRILFAAFDKKGFVSDDNGDTWRQISIASTGLPSKDYVGLTMQGHPTKKNKFIATMGYYNPNPGTVIISDDFGTNAAKSRRPAFFRNTYGANDFQKWAQFHPTRGNVAYSTTAFSSDEGENWVRWTTRADSTYRSQVGEPTSRTSAAGVRMASPKNGDWLIASHATARRLFLSKDMGLTWSQFTSNGPELYGMDLASLWMDPTDENIIYWWRGGTGMIRYDERTGRETVLPGTVKYRNMRVQRIRSDYRNPDILYFFNRLDGGDMVFRSTTGHTGTFEDISSNLPRQIGNQGFEIDPKTGILWMNGVIGTRIFPPPGGHPRYDELARRSRA